jgi:hypothetical protein
VLKPIASAQPCNSFFNYSYERWKLELRKYQNNGGDHWKFAEEKKIKLTAPT